MIGLVGDDVVDLADPHNVAPHPRFAHRVTSDAEREMLAASSEPLSLLWTLFAAKEAAFKVIAKLGPPPVFSHASFEVSRDLGSVRWRQLELALMIERGDGFVHVVATRGRPPVLPVLWEVERIGTGRDPSVAARELLARVLAREDDRLRPEDVEVVREPRPGSWDGFGPPRLLLRGEPTTIDPSLSHDGRFVAVALAGAEPG